MSYDEVLYPDRVFPLTHPGPLAALARLHGVDAPDPARARVLELGCGAGANLSAMAAAWPDATFVGVDNAAEPIRRARERAPANAEFRRAGLEDIADEPFDYVVAHGVFSWVPEHVREALLALAGRVLAPDGIAYVSYNALPGGRLRELLREALAVHLADVEGHAERIQAARGLLRLFVAAHDADAELAPVLARAAREVIDAEDAYLFHDLLSPDNQPFSIEGFVARARAHGLDYLTEAQFSETQTGGLPAAFATVVESIGDPVRRELYLDLLKERRFRQTLLCRPGRRRAPDADRLAGLRVAASLTRTDADGETTFHGPGTAAVTTADPLVVRVLAALSTTPTPVAALGSSQEAPAIHAALLRCLAANLVRVTV